LLHVKKTQVDIDYDEFIKRGQPPSGPHTSCFRAQDQHGKKTLNIPQPHFFVKAWWLMRLRMLGLLVCGLGLHGQILANPNHSAHPVALWPTLPFVRGQDLCQYQDAYGRTRAQQSSDMARLLGNLIRAGADPQQATELLQTMDSLIDQGRQRATGGFGMDVLLEGSFKAALDRVYEMHHPQVRKVSFFNPTALSELVRVLRAQQRQGSLEAKQLGGLTGVAWGTYSYSPGCKGDVLVTLHIETQPGQTYNYQARGMPESVMGQIADQVFSQFQRTHFPSQINHQGKTLELLGAPGNVLGLTNSPRKAQYACECMQARLPTVGEYIYLSELGNWNGGVSSAKGLWALSQERVMAPEMPNPSIVRSIKEFQSPEIRYFCVRHVSEKKTTNQCSP
jgi:hypothetical protein